MCCDTTGDMDDAYALAVVAYEALSGARLDHELRAQMLMLSHHSPEHDELSRFCEACGVSRLRVPLRCCLPQHLPMHAWLFCLLRLPAEQKLLQDRAYSRSYCWNVLHALRPVQDGMLTRAACILLLKLEADEGGLTRAALCMGHIQIPPLQPREGLRVPQTVTAALAAAFDRKIVELSPLVGAIEDRLTVLRGIWPLDAKLSRLLTGVYDWLQLEVPGDGQRAAELRAACAAAAPGRCFPRRPRGGCRARPPAALR